MPVIAAIRELFPESGEPYMLCEICERLHATFPDAGINYGRVWRAWHALLADEQERDKVQPRRWKRRKMKFSAEAARRIAREAVPSSTRRAVRALQEGEAAARRKRPT